MVSEILGGNSLHVNSAEERETGMGETTQGQKDFHHFFCILFQQNPVLWLECEGFRSTSTKKCDNGKYQEI